jgi:hypothetical protein
MSAVESLGGIPNAAVLAGFMADKGFCLGPQKPPFSRSLPAGLGGTVFRPFGMAMERVSVGYRLDGNRPGWAWSIPFLRLPRLDGWVGGRLNFLFERRQAIRRTQFDETPLRDLLETDGAVQFDIFYMRSAGRLLDWYASGGIDQRPIRETVFDSVVDTETRPAFEGGVRVRFPVPDLMKRSLHLPFWGVRVGGRRSSDHTTFVVEAGLGAW